MPEPDGSQVGSPAPGRRHIRVVSRAIDMRRLPIGTRRSSVPKAGPLAVAKASFTPLGRERRRQIPGTPVGGLATSPPMGSITVASTTSEEPIYTGVGGPTAAEKVMAAASVTETASPRIP